MLTTPAGDPLEPATEPEPAFLDAEPPGLDAVEDGSLWPAREVRRLVNGAWAAARRSFEAQRRRDRERFEADYQAKRDELIARVAQETAAIVRGNKGT